MMEVVVGAAEADVTVVDVADGTVLFVLPEETDDDGTELVVSTVVLVLPEVADDGTELVVSTVVLVLPEVADVDSPLPDVVLAVEALSTPWEKIRMQARTAT